MVDSVFVVIPAYNAGATIEKVFARLPAQVRERISRYVVVNDGSADDTEAALARLRARYPDLVTLTHSTNRGYGAAAKTLLSYALQEKADLAIVRHSDGHYAPGKIPELLRPFHQEVPGTVQGSRMLRR